jgi:acetyl esterase
MRLDCGAGAPLLAPVVLRVLLLRSGLEWEFLRMTTAYNPDARFEVKIWEEEFRQVPSRTLMARIYQPIGDAPFPVLLDLHGGAWTFKDRMANAGMAEAMAASGLLTVSVDLRLGGEAPYPASVQDANYAIRWLKTKAASWNGDPVTMGLLGSSSGGHVAQLLGMRPTYPAYNSIELSGHPHVDARINYVATRSPISDPLARYNNAVAKGRIDMAERHHIYFNPFSDIEQGNPQLILERAEAVELPPMLVMQGGLDDNVLPAFQEKFGETYRAAGGECEVAVFEGCDHLWVLEAGPDTERAHEMVRQFIATQLARFASN